MARAGAVCVAIALLTWGGLARAQNTSSLSWVRLAGAESCIGTQALAEQVEQRLGRRVFVSASQADLSLEGHVEPAPDGFVATLVVSDRQGQSLGRRTLRVRGRDCSPLAASLVLVIAIAVDPGASSAALLGPSRELSPEAKAMLEQLELPKLSEAELVAELTARSEPQGGPGDSAPRPRSDPPPRARSGKSAAEPELRRRTELRLFAGVALSLGVLPEPGFGATLGVTVTTGWFWPVDLWLEGLLEQEHSALASAGAGELGFLGGGLSVCAPLPSTRTWLPRACGGLRGGALTARGRGFASSQAADGAWLEPTLYGGIVLRLSALTLHANAGVGAPILRDRFRYEDATGQAQTLHRAAPVTGRFELGAGTTF